MDKFKEQIVRISEAIDLGKRLGSRSAVVEILGHVIDHPEIGAVLDSQCGAQSEGCAFDTADRSREAAPEWLDRLLCACEMLWRAGHLAPIRAVLASDGWWWKV